MIICYFGNYDPEYSRNRILIKGLKKNGVRVLECNDRTPGWRKYLNILKKHRQLGGKYDILIIGYSVRGSRLLVFLAKLISRKPVVWDALFSLYDNWIFDRQLASPYSLKALYYWLSDWLACFFADLIILDTYGNIGYFIKTFNISPKKFVRVLVGTDDEVIYFREKIKEDKFIAFFHGRYIPVQGAEYIVKAAKILENEKDIEFRLLGSGQDFKRVKKIADDLGLKNVLFLPPVPYEKLPDFIAQADVCFGLLGLAPRADRAIPNKVYEAAGMRKAIINAATTSIKEVFIDRENILLCRAGNPADIALKITELKNNPELKEKISNGAFEVVKNIAFPVSLGRFLKGELRNLLNR
jgi:glycosyltransferase involved in cell wall biosynthesis